MTGNLHVLLLGYGEMGHAMHHLLGGTAAVDIWEKWPQAGFSSVLLEEAAPRAEVVIFCLPAAPHRQVLQLIQPLLRSECICLSIAKGLDESGATVAQIFADSVDGRQPYGLLYGPMISEEICAGRFAFAQLGCADRAIYQRISDLFNGTRLYLEYTADINGISWSVILKNVYAMVFGMADELRLGDNVRGYLAVAALNELDRIVQTMGGVSGSPYQLAGLGDLITTATSVDSHHYELGCKLARQDTRDIQGEGVHTLDMVCTHSLFRPQDYPLFHLIHGLVRNPRDMRTRIEAYISSEAEKRARPS